MGAPSSPSFSLSALLLDLFSQDEFSHFLLEHHPDLLSAIPKKDSDETYFDNAALVLFRHGLVGGDFFDSLFEARPRQGRRIYRVQAELERSKPGARGLVDFTFESSIEELDVERLSRLVAVLREMVKDDSVVVVSLRPGSIILCLSVTQETCEMLFKMSALEGFGEHYKETLRSIAVEVFEIRIISSHMFPLLYEDQRRREEKLHVRNTAPVEHKFEHHNIFFEELKNIKETSAEEINKSQLETRRLRVLFSIAVLVCVLLACVLLILVVRVQMSTS